MPVYLQALGVLLRGRDLVPLCLPARKLVRSRVKARKTRAVSLGTTRVLVNGGSGGLSPKLGILIGC